ncbi:hypothetical protein PENSPDRAFT_639051 [Peniophora sp. CONT]|nr:hypothetical protein PENSPDRAFT_639051 [Peniophora sp. CONT]
MRPLTALPTFIALSFFLFLYLAPEQQQRHSLHRRYTHSQNPDKRVPVLGLGGDDSTSPSATAASSTAAASTTTTTSSSTSETPTSSPSSSATSTPASSTTQSASSTTQGSSAASSPSSGISAAPSNTQQSVTATPTPSSFTTVNSAGQTVIQVISDTPTASASSASSTSSSAASNSNKDDDDGVSTSTIVGLSVAGGVAVLGIVAFFIWKFTRKRFHDLDDNEAIKWPELNAHDGTAGASANRGFDDDGASIRPGGLGMNNNYASSVAATSTTELYPAGADPYAVPPLPQFNPSQPYRDDPNTLYDPYGGPAMAPPSAESIPMTQLAGRRSPAPFAGYDQGMGGRGSPAPSGYAPQFVGEPGRVLSPAPMQGGYGERARSPGPNMAMGRASPAPQGAGGYGYQ